MFQRCYDNSEKIECNDVEPICECPHENVYNKYIYHDVPHIVPMHTTIVNHHIYKHTYTPYYTCSEVNTCENVYDDVHKM